MQRCMGKSTMSLKEMLFLIIFLYKLKYFYNLLFQLHLFLSKLTGTQIGFTTVGLLTITKEFLLTVGCNVILIL